MGLIGVFNCGGACYHGRGKIRIIEAGDKFPVGKKKQKSLSGNRTRSARFGERWLTTMLVRDDRRKLVPDALYRLSKTNEVSYFCDTFE